MERKDTATQCNLPGTPLMMCVNRIMRFMESRDETILSDVFTHEKSIFLDSFAPYLFQGAGAKDRWAKSFIAHTKNITNLRHTLGSAQEYSHHDQKVFFSMPVIWEGEVDGKSFHETGALALLFVQQDNQWRVQHYSWAAASFMIK